MDDASTQSGRVGTVRFVRMGWAGAMLVLGLVVAGCSGDGDVADPTAVGATSVSSVTSSTAPATGGTTTTSTSVFIPVQPQDLPPVPIPEQTPESAVAFLQWWFAMLNRVELTGETELIRENSLPDCVFCNGQIANIEGILAAGRRIESGGDTKVTDLFPSPVDTKGYVLIEFTGETPAGRSVDADGNVVAEFPLIPPSPLLAGVQWLDGRWFLKDVADRI